MRVSIVAAAAVLILASLRYPTVLTADPYDSAYRGLRQTSTEYFTFIFEPRDRESVAELVAYADAVYEVLAEFLDNEPPGKIPVFVNGRTDIANGYFDPVPRHHIGLFVASPSQPLIGARSENWLRLLFVHELAHYLHFMYDEGVFGALSRVFGEPVLAMPGVFMPGWAIEGIAIEAETRFSQGGRGRNPMFEVYYSAPIIEGKMFGFDRAGFDSYLPPRGRFYVAGYIYVSFLLERFGEHVFAEIYREYLRAPFLGLSRAIEAVTDASARTLWNEMVEALEQRYAGRELMSQGRDVVPEGIADYHPPQADGGALYSYRTAPNRRPAIVRVDEGSEEVVLTTTLTDGESFDIADGSLLFASFDSTATRPGALRTKSHLYIAAAGDRNPQRVSTASGIYHPRFAGNGTHAIAVQRIGQYHRLVWIHLESGELTPLYEPEQVYLYTPTVGRGGTRLAFIENRAGRQQLRVIGLPEPGTAFHGRPESPAELTGDEAHYRPAWGNEGELYYISDRGGLLRAWRAGYRGSNAITPSAQTARGESSQDANHDGAGARPIGDDPVGVLSVLPESDRYIYGTYRTTGYRVFRGLHLSEQKSEVSRVPSELTSDQYGESGFGSDQPDNRPVEPVDSFEERRFFDIPWPGVWFPYPSLLSASEGRVHIGIGIGTFGSNYRRTATSSATIAWHPSVGQPQGGLALSGRFGPIAAEFDFSQSFGLADPSDPDSHVSQRTAVQLLTRFNLLAHNRRGIQRSFGPFAHGYYERTISAEDDFSFRFSGENAGDAGDSIAAGSPVAERSRMELSGGLFYRRMGRNVRRDLYENRLIRLQGQVSRDLPTVGIPLPGYRIRATADTVIPLAGSGAGLSLATAAAYWTAAVPAVSTFGIPGVGRPANLSLQPGRFSARAGVRGTFALTDTPLPLGFNLQGLAGGLYAELQGGFGTAANDLNATDELLSPQGGLTLDQHIWLSVELLASLGYSIGIAQVRGGITVPVSMEGIGRPGLYLRF